MSDTPTTEAVVLELLTENTGRHLLDSGGAYGRNWERNQSVDWSSVPSSTLSFKYGIDVTHNLHAWLPERVSYEAKADEAFHEWGSARENEAWLQSAERWVEIVGGTGPFGSGTPFVVNTYNGEDLLSQTIQYVQFALESDALLPAPGSEEQYEPACKACQGSGYQSQEADEDGTLCADCGGDGFIERNDAPTLSAGTYVLLQVHGGADVRGGYTRPRLFAVDDDTGLYDNARAYIYCSNDSEHNWSTDDANHWYFDGTCGYGAETQLEAYDRVEVDFTEGDLVEPAVADPAARIGKLVIDTDTDTGYCPRCGVGTLSAHA